MKPEVHIEDAGPCRKVMHVRAPTEQVAPDYDDVVRAYRRAGRVPGFRQGKAPAAVVERHYGRQIAEDAKERLVPRLYREALEEAGITPVAIVEVKHVSFAKATGLSFDVVMDVAPEFKLPRYKKLSLKGEKVTVSDEDVEQTLEQLREREAKYEDVTGRPVRDGDLTRLDFTGRVDGKAVGDVEPAAAALSEGRDFWHRVGGDEAIPGLSEGVKGASEGETRDLSSRFPDDSPYTGLRGREAEFRVTVRGIRERVPPAVDAADFLKTFDAETPEALRERIRKDVTAYREEGERDRLRGELSRRLIEQCAFDLPQSVVEQETRLMVRETVQRMAMQGGTREQIEQQQDAIYNRAVESSRDRVALRYILSRIADAEHLDAEDAEVEQRIEAMARAHRTPPERLRAEIEKRNGIEGLKSDIRGEKALNFVLEHAKIKT
ncbi:MAG: trigger factor [Lentisphaerae bacterium]|nr:trigger factor [Lentisphaerota bacterium]